MERKSGIYMWTSPSGKSYIGQSVNLVVRKRFFCTFNHTYGGHKIECARKKYNHKSLWDYKVLEYCDIDMLDEREKYYIILYDSINNGYNLDSGGNANKIVSDETRKKQSESHKGMKHTNEHNLKISESLKGHTLILTEESKNKMRLSHNKSVVQYTKKGTFVAEYESALVAKEKTGIDNGHISACCRGKRKSAGGFKWTYKNPPLLKE